VRGPGRRTTSSSSSGNQSAVLAARLPGAHGTGPRPWPLPTRAWPWDRFWKCDPDGRDAAQVAVQERVVGLDSSSEEGGAREDTGDENYELCTWGRRE
jgi:hypothetical protein